MFSLILSNDRWYHFLGCAQAAELDRIPFGEFCLWCLCVLNILFKIFYHSSCWFPVLFLCGLRRLLLWLLSKNETHGNMSWHLIYSLFWRIWHVLMIKICTLWLLMGHFKKYLLGPFAQCYGSVLMCFLSFWSEYMSIDETNGIVALKLQLVLHWNVFLTLGLIMRTLYTCMIWCWVLEKLCLCLQEYEIRPLHCI